MKNFLPTLIILFLSSLIEASTRVNFFSETSKRPAAVQVILDKVDSDKFVSILGEENAFAVLEYVKEGKATQFIVGVKGEDSSPTTLARAGNANKVVFVSDNSTLTPQLGFQCDVSAKLKNSTCRFWSWMHKEDPSGPDYLKEQHVFHQKDKQSYLVSFVKDAADAKSLYERLNLPVQTRVENVSKTTFTYEYKTFSSSDGTLLVYCDKEHSESLQQTDSYICYFGMDLKNLKKIETSSAQFDTGNQNFDAHQDYVKELHYVKDQILKNFQEGIDEKRKVADSLRNELIRLRQQKFERAIMSRPRSLSTTNPAAQGQVEASKSAVLRAMGSESLDLISERITGQPSITGMIMKIPNYDISVKRPTYPLKK